MAPDIHSILMHTLIHPLRAVGATAPDLTDYYTTLSPILSFAPRIQPTHTNACFLHHQKDWLVGVYSLVHSVRIPLAV
ncbi:hypothetical protein EXIGLDRAFT_720870, partial [Exidia glandulosa HHB12029]